MLDIGSSSDIQEVGRLSTLNLDNVHSGHGQTGSIDHASDVAIQSNIVQTSLDGLVLVGVDVFGSEGVLLQVDKFLLSELSVVVNVDFGINTVDLVFRVDCPWVDLDLSGVTVGEKLVKSLDFMPESGAFFEFEVSFQSV